MNLVQRYKQHAKQCGIDMTGKRCVDTATVSFGTGYWLARDIIDPETQMPIYEEGFWLSASAMRRLWSEYGIDYIITSGE